MATGDTASDPLLAAVTKRGEEGSLTFTKDSKILARSAGTRQRHHQRAQPGTRPGCLRNQAVNNLSGAEFSGGEVSFAGARFAGGEVSFAGTRFAGGEVSF